MRRPFGLTVLLGRDGRRANSPHSFWLRRGAPQAHRGMRTVGSSFLHKHASETRMAGYFKKSPDLDCSMDIEHINLIGTTLADLTARTRELRGYL